MFIKKIFFITTLLFSVFCFQTIYADIGPKPFSEFYFKYKTGEPFSFRKNDGVKILSCEDTQSSNRENGFQSSVPYVSFPNDTHKVETTLTDKEKQYSLFSERLELYNSHHTGDGCLWKEVHHYYGMYHGKSHNSYYDSTFPKKDFKIAFWDSEQQMLSVSDVITVKGQKMRAYKLYEVVVDGPYLYVHPTLSYLKGKSNILLFFLALFITLLVEYFVARIFLKKQKLSKKILRAVVLGSIITLPVLWFVFFEIGNAKVALFFGEIFAFVFEALLIFHFYRKDISLKKSFILSFLMNLSSFLIGELFFRYILFFFVSLLFLVTMDNLFFSHLFF